MRFDIFEKMTSEEASLLLKEVLGDGAANVGVMRAHAIQSGVNADYSVDTLAAFLRWSLSEIRTVPRRPDSNIPNWIGATNDYQKGLFDFDERSGNLIVFAAYYMGECFIRSLQGLKWASGNAKFAQANMPVVTGFPRHGELAPMLVLENLFRRVIKDPALVGDLDVAVGKWRQDVEGISKELDSQ